MKVAIVVAVLCMFASMGNAQMSSDTTAAINGAVNPELIPDSVVYRHFFQMIAWAITNEAKYPGTIDGCPLLAPFNDTDRAVLKGAAMTWTTTVGKMDADYNAKNEAGQTTSADQLAFKQARAKFTLDTAASVKASLSTNGVTILGLVIQSKKASISMDKGAF